MSAVRSRVAYQGCLDGGLDAVMAIGQGDFEDALAHQHVVVLFIQANTQKQAQRQTSYNSAMLLRPPGALVVPTSSPQVLTCSIFCERHDAKVMRHSSFTTMTRSGSMARILEMRLSRRFSLVSFSMYFFLRARDELAERRFAALGNHVQN